MLLLGDLVTAISVELVRHLQHPELKRPHPISAERGAMQQGRVVRRFRKAIAMKAKYIKASKATGAITTGPV
jgi:hypothetical protein